MYWDSHMHTSFSFDSDAAPEDQIRRAAEIGLPGICITDHMDFVWGDDQPYLYDADAYCRTLSALREKYADRIRINIGIELGCQAEMTDTLAAALAEHPYDFVIGSTHFAEGMDPYYREYFDGRTNPEGFRAFFERILENIKHVYHDLRVPVTVRVPTIPGCNDSDENIAATARFVAAELGREVPVHLRPYHQLGESKNESLGRKPDLSVEVPSEEHMQRLFEL